MSSPKNARVFDALFAPEQIELARVGAAVLSADRNGGLTVSWTSAISACAISACQKVAVVSAQSASGHNDKLGYLLIAAHLTQLLDNLGDATLEHVCRPSSCRKHVDLRTCTSAD